MLVLILLLAFYCSFDAALAITENDCPSILPRDKYLKTHGDKCYYFYFDVERDYSEAKDICYNSGGSLALVKTKDINGFLHIALAYDFKGETTNDLWIGLTDLEQEGHYKWIDGSTMDYENFGTLQGPHGFLISKVDDCIAMDPDSGKWHDYHCESFLFLVNEERPFICEYQAEVHTTIPPTTLPPTTLRSTLATTKKLSTVVTTTKGRTPSTMASTTPSITTKKVTSPVVPLLTGKIVIPQQSATITQTSATTPRPVPSTTCPSIICNNDCGLQGFKTDLVTGCVLCECDA